MCATLGAKFNVRPFFQGQPHDNILIISAVQNPNSDVFNSFEDLTTITNQSSNFSMKELTIAFVIYNDSIPIS